MATNLDIIKRAMKKIHVLASGSNPTAAEAADGMSALQSLIVELIGQGSLGRLNDVLATAAYTAFEFDRIRASNGVTITLPTTITAERCGLDPVPYGYETSTYPRPPYDRAIVVVTGSNYLVGVTAYTTKTSWMYDAYSGAWVNLNSLTQQGAFPLADYLEDGFAAFLAERLVDNFDGGEVGAETKRQANACRNMLSAKYDSATQPAQAAYF